jgi:EAL domain-containing protein (putative c-di-GMP-specific phosphodiesterase class I)
VEDHYEAAELAEHLLSLFNEPVTVERRSLQVTATIGVALYPVDASEPDQLLQHAEHTMTLAKTEANNHSRFYIASVDQEIRARKQLEKDLSQALRNNELHLVYQPQISLQSNRIIGAEALLRWTHPERGMVPPDEFIPLSEVNGTIVEIGQWVLNEACRQAALWAAAGMPLRIAVNLSAVQLRHPDIVGTILATLGRHEIPPGRLELEVTETGFMENLEDAVEKLRQLNSAGINIAVDDFGTGYSSLTYLKRMPVQHLKIDKQFIQDLLVNEEDTRIANTIIDLAPSVSLVVQLAI